MRFLLSDGSGLTAKQTSYQLGRQGHDVEVLAPKGLSLTRFTRYVRAIHTVPRYGPDPLGWLEEMLCVWSVGQFDMLIPTQEQVAVLSLFPERLLGAGVVSALPGFEALASVQDKVSAFSTLDGLGLPQPAGRIVESANDLADCSDLPLFVKLPIGTATSGVTLVSTRHQARSLAARLEVDGAFDEGAVLVQSPVDGPLAMVQSVFDRGRLIAFHACWRRGEGVNGGASHKRSAALPEVRDLMAQLGGSLGWHGALSADVVMGVAGPRFIDINPRLVEPANAFAAGVDLLAALVAVARPADAGRGAVSSTMAIEASAGRPGCDTHQLLLAVLGAASEGRRAPIVATLAAALGHRGPYRHSVEELTPMAHDWRAVLPVLAASLVTLASPSTSSLFTEGSVANYALTPAGWSAIVSAARLTRVRSDPTASDWPH
jgi:hypothetical protein